MPSLGDRALLKTAPWFAARLIKVIYLLLKPETLGEERLDQLRSEGLHVIFATWHDQLLLISPRYTGGAAKVLISKSRDGELIARVVSYFGIEAVRGSSNRGGRAAFRELMELSRQPCTLGITPDGPTGPRHQLKDGVVQLARLSGRPIVPLAFACSHGHRFASWDRFLLPYPWGKAVYTIGEPLYYRDNETSEAFQDRVQEAMDANTTFAREYLNQYGLSAV